VNLITVVKFISDLALTLTQPLALALAWIVFFLLGLTLGYCEIED
jgi:hypothetical protein